MQGPRTCRSCGVEITANAPFGNCPKCLIELSFLRPEENLAERLISNPSARLKFGDYELIEQIGRGGMGIVYKARQLSLNRLVAVKMILHSRLASPGAFDRLIREAETAGRLEHPNIVSIYDIGEEDGQPFFSMRLVDGHGLDYYISKAGFQVEAAALPGTKRRGPQAAAARLVAKIAIAVDYAHKHGVLHRDLKPANVVVDASGEPHLTDFGLAKVIDRESTIRSDSDSIKGTPAYMAPEQAAGGSRNVSTAVDVYGLGAILYAMLTGHPPFRADTPVETLRQVVEETPKDPTTFNDSIDSELATICLKCLEKDPARRYRSATALAEDLERWLRHEPVEARPVGAMGRLWRWCQREPIVAGMTAGIFLLSATTAVLTTILYWKEKATRITAELQGTQESRTLMERLERERDEGDSIYLSAKEIAVLARTPFVMDGSEKRLTLAARTQERNPDRTIVPFAHLLTNLQARLKREGNGAVLFDLRLYNRVEDTLQVLATDVDLAWCDAAIYVTARRQFLGLVPLVRETYRGGSELRGAIVTSVGSGITNLSDLKGRSFAFTGPESAVGWYLPKAKLVQAGLRWADLTLTNFPSARVLKLVRQGEFDAGAVLWSDYEKLIQAGGQVRLLSELRCPSHPLVLKSKLDTNFVAAFRRTLLSLPDHEVLGRLPNDVSGFVEADPRSYDELEREIQIAKQFDEVNAR